MAAFGGFLSLIRVVSNYLLADYQTFSLENGIIKKLYSAQEVRPHKEGTDVVETVYKDVATREIFSYKFGEFWLSQKFGSAMCCCCRRKETASDKMYKEAKRKIAAETDLLKLIRAKRLTEFLGLTQLTPSQVRLISFFREYTLLKEGTYHGQKVRQLLIKTLRCSHAGA